jgi:hypothetical protein
LFSTLKGKTLNTEFPLAMGHMEQYITELSMDNSLPSNAFILKLLRAELKQ